MPHGFFPFPIQLIHSGTGNPLVFIFFLLNILREIGRNGLNFFLYTSSYELPDPGRKIPDPYQDRAKKSGFGRIRISNTSGYRYMENIDGHNRRWIDTDSIDRYFWSHFHRCN